LFRTILDRNFRIPIWMPYWGSVPSAFVAYNNKTHEPGALIEWFYTPNQENFVLGGDILQAKIEGFERKKGRQQNFQSIIEILLDPFWKLEKNWLENWVKILTFDALIGNTDRHPDNWGIILENFDLVLQSSDVEKLTSRMAPAFDNGTSMGYEQLEKALYKFKQQAYLQKYVNKGKPHLKWSLEEDYGSRSNQAKLLNRIMHTYPHLRDSMLSCFHFSRKQVADIIWPLLEFDIMHQLTLKRATFMLDLICYRQEHLLSSLNRP
jgi:hypothetical protein